MYSEDDSFCKTGLYTTVITVIVKKKRLYIYVLIFKYLHCHCKKLMTIYLYYYYSFTFGNLKHPNQQGAVLHDFNVNSPLNVRDAH